ncbi:MAG: TlpA family protein disulfide reductase [Reichenbachiella sp.]
MKISKELKEWGIMIVIFGTLYFTGYYKDVAGFLQGMILEIGFMKPDQIEENDQQTASYDFFIRDVNGQKIDFHSFEGKTVFINYWATWCPPCIAEMPDINDLYHNMKDQNIEFVMISLDEDFDKAKKFVDRKGYDFPIYQMASQRPVVYNSNSIPTTYVLSKKGKIVAKRSGMAKYDTEEFRTFLLNN